MLETVSQFQQFLGNLGLTLIAAAGWILLMSLTFDLLLAIRRKL
jgi:hypothetical protein